MKIKHIPVSIIILTKNEEINLRDCLSLLDFSDDIHVYDSYSTDGTLDIARQNGCIITQRKFDDWSSHQNWGLRNINFKYKWVLYLDADERVSPAMVDFIQRAVSENIEYVAWRFQRRDYFNGRWLKHVQASSHYIRLFRPGCITYERLVNPITKVAGPIGIAKGHIDHYPFSKGIEQWIEKHNSYSTFEALDITSPTNRKPGSWFLALTASDPLVRKEHQKKCFYRLPLRGFIMFFAMYIVKRGFLDGLAGFHYSILRAFYEFQIEIKTAEILNQSRTTPLTDK